MSRIVAAGADGWKRASFQEFPQVSLQWTPRESMTSRDPAAAGYESIRAAEREAEAILLSARELAQQIEQEAHREGLAKGRAEALDEMRRRLEPLEALLREACRRVASAHQAVMTNVEGELIDLALAVAERVLRSELRTRREAVVPVIRAALEAAGSRKIMGIRVSPGEYELLAEHRDEFVGSLESARLIADPAISDGGCVVEIEAGLIDARLESQLQEAARLLGKDPLV